MWRPPNLAVRPQTIATLAMVTMAALHGGWIAFWLTRLFEPLAADWSVLAGGTISTGVLTWIAIPRHGPWTPFRWGWRVIAAGHVNTTGTYLCSVILYNAWQGDPLLGWSGFGVAARSGFGVAAGAFFAIAIISFLLFGVVGAVVAIPFALLGAVPVSLVETSHEVSSFDMSRAALSGVGVWMFCVALIGVGISWGHLWSFAFAFTATVGATMWGTAAVLKSLRERRSDAGRCGDSVA